ncbi:MAG: chloride channel protein [Prevotellaceae bacterium]|jgi:CIC family chloride channel protein|nr:chloride channel protein [Prevotellaceae bacterium]
MTHLKHSTINRVKELLLNQIERIDKKRLIYILSLLVGLCSGLAAVLLKHTIHLVKDSLTSWFDAAHDSLLYLAYPGIGILITIIYVKYFVKNNIGHGITKVLYAISRKHSELEPHNMYTSIAASSFTIGFGGSVGAEAPIVLTGSAIGSNIGRFFNLNYKQITLLLGCGAAGAVSGIFKAPLAGIVFTLEILMLDLSLASIIPLLISSITALCVSYFLIGSDVAFGNTLQPFAMNNLPYYLVLGVFCGFVSLYFTRTTMAIEKRLNKTGSIWQRWLAGTASLGLLVFFIPSLYGEGYDTLTAMMTGNAHTIFDNSLFSGMQENTWFFVLYLVAILIFKVVAMAATTGSGGVGGTFGPTLFMGGIAGFLTARLINISGIHQVPESNFALVGMAGAMAGVMQAPLTAIFLIAEITGGYMLLMPLMVTSVVSFMTIRGFESHSIYTKRLAQEGDLLTHNRDKATLTLLQTDNLIETDFVPVSPDDDLGTLVKAVSRSKRNIFPVVNRERGIEGVILLDDIRDTMFEPNLYRTIRVSSIMRPVPATVSIGEPMEKVIEIFEKTQAWNLPVVDENGKYKGFLSKSKIFSSYREMLKELFGDD